MMMGEYEDDDQRTDEEIGEDYQLFLVWAQLANEWEAAGRLCRCGKPITLDDAFYFGICDTCRLEEIPF